MKPEIQWGVPYTEEGSQSCKIATENHKALCSDINYRSSGVLINLVHKVNATTLNLMKELRKISSDLDSRLLSLQIWQTDPHRDLI